MTKQHKFTTLKQMEKVATVENVDVMAEDLKNWLILCANANEINRMAGTTIAKVGGFTWIDDGKNDATINVEVREKEKNPVSKGTKGETE